MSIFTRLEAYLNADTIAECTEYLESLKELEWIVGYEFKGSTVKVSLVAPVSTLMFSGDARQAKQSIQLMIKQWLK